MGIIFRFIDRFYRLFSFLLQSKQKFACWGYPSRVYVILLQGETRLQQGSRFRLRGCRELGRSTRTDEVKNAICLHTRDESKLLPHLLLRVVCGGILTSLRIKTWNKAYAMACA
ncbi:hypothetical protein Y032_0046g1414 [Ancylostoma ceylanicum]|uniref:Uncharacterized protein n=1 Tax=Ancylostoma ceylanicum TaxID=53326 RepID=A0A016UBQ9_9BILA|nr:hypothetical protein Y032_0046g1414 [Ancylostoma ceylanicum]